MDLADLTELFLGFPIPSIHRIIKSHSQNSKNSQNSKMALWFGFGWRLKPISSSQGSGHLPPAQAAPSPLPAAASMWKSLSLLGKLWASSTSKVCVCHPSPTLLLDLKVEMAAFEPIFRARERASFAPQKGPSRTMAKGGKVGLCVRNVIKDPLISSELHCCDLYLPQAPSPRLFISIQPFLHPWFFHPSPPSRLLHCPVGTLGVWNFLFSLTLNPRRTLL